MPVRRWTDEQIIQAFLDWEAIFGSPPTMDDWEIGWDGEYPNAKTVKKHFGSWQAGKDAAWPPKVTRTPASQWPKERIIEELQRFAREHDGFVAHKDLTPRNGLPSATLVKNKFGSVEKAIRAAGLIPIPFAVNKQQIKHYLPLRRGS